MAFPHLHTLLLGNLWAVEPERFQMSLDVLAARMNGKRKTAEELADIVYSGDCVDNGNLVLMAADASGSILQSKAGTGRIEASAGDGNGNGGYVGVINVFGVMQQHAYQVMNISGPAGVSAERVSQSFQAALADPNVKSIVLRMNSPGGNVHGTEELANEIFRARRQKPIIAQVDSLSASNNYWLATQADEIVATNGGEAGSIGVYTVHEDQSKKAENDGVRYTIVSAGKFKMENHPFGPLSEEAQQHLQGRVNEAYDKFVAAVARGRGVKADDVRKGYGEGRVLSAKTALQKGMIDRIGTFSETIKRLSTPQGRRAAMSAGAVSPGAISRGPGVVVTETQMPGELDAFRRRRYAYRVRCQR